MGGGNKDKWIDRHPRICAAGLPSGLDYTRVSDCLNRYTLQDEVDALLRDAVVPAPRAPPPPPLRREPPPDMRNAGVFSQMSELVTPPIKSKFQTVVEDLKETVYASYWKKALGKTKDMTPLLPSGLDPVKTTFGKPTPYPGRLYDIVMPAEPPPDKTPWYKGPGVQIPRHYCSPPFDPALTFGHRSRVERRGRGAFCAIRDDHIVRGTDLRCVMNSVQADFREVTAPKLATSLAPNANIKMVKEGYSFGILKPPDNMAECLTFCEINPGLHFFRKCLEHMNKIRHNLSKRDPSDFSLRDFYENLKYFDKNKTGWLHRDIVQIECGKRLIRFDPALIEPLLEVWDAYRPKTQEMDYKTFVYCLNYHVPMKDLPRVEDIAPSCLDYRTTYGEMIREGQVADPRPTAGLPSRRLDLDYPITPLGTCRAYRVHLSDETDCKASISPSVFTQHFLTHRDLYETRSAEQVREIFEYAGDKLTDEEFEEVWKKAQALQKDGLVCVETFRRILDDPARKPATVVTD